MAVLRLSWMIWCSVLLIWVCLDHRSSASPQSSSPSSSPKQQKQPRQQQQQRQRQQRQVGNHLQTGGGIGGGITKVGTHNNGRYQNLSESAESKVERLGQTFKQSVRELRERSLNASMDLVFLVDESSSVGAANFRLELRFVRKLLSDFPVAPEETRVALVTFSSKSHVVTRVDHISAPRAHQHKCSLFNQEIPAITYRGGGTYTKGAFQRAAQILQNSRRNASKVIFLITDGYSNGGDPRPVAAALRSGGVEIFTLGIWQGNIRELHDMASHPKDQHCYLVHNFAEFDALARRALHEDLPTGGYIQEDLSHCSSLCEAGQDCCDLMASCRCGTHTGQYDCVCEKGHYGKGLQHECTACPSGTYKPEATPGGLTSCLACPDKHHTSQPASTALSDCVCQEGYKASGKTCEVVHCPELSPPENGFFIQGQCNNQFNAACGVRCKAGYELQGSSIRLCQPDGTWSGVDGSCKVRSCPKLSAPPHGQVNCSEGGIPHRLKCEVRCAKGYRLAGGSAKLTCQSNYQWNGPLPRCVEVRCPPIVPAKHVSLSPPACGVRELRSGASCKLSCRLGYRLRGEPVVRCLATGEWSQHLHKAACVDSEPPWIQCPDDVVTETRKHQSLANVTWSQPIAGDSSGEEVAVQVTPVLNAHQLFPIGTAVITYTAGDRSGNRANCSFTVTVIDTEPPIIDKCRSPPVVDATGPETAVVWEVPQFSDNSGRPLNISSTHLPGALFPDGETSVLYTATDASGNNHTCELTITVQGKKCVQPYMPVNADFTCVEKDEGVNCTLRCRDGYSFTQNAVHSYFCAHNGVWLPPRSPDRPDCSLNRVANNGLKPFEMLFKTSRCDDQDMLKNFRGEFNTALKDMVPALCGDDVACKLEVISQGQCLEYDYYENGFAIGPGGWGNNWGSQNGQDYAYFDAGFATDSQGPPMQGDQAFPPGTRHPVRAKAFPPGRYPARAKRQRKIAAPTRDQKIQINFNITASIPLPVRRNDSVEVVNQRRLLKALEQLTNRLKRTLAKQPFTSFSVSSEMIVADPKSLESRRAALYCRPGSVLKGRMCVQCPLGTYFSLEYGECESCWIGSYQDEEGQMECKPCPDGFSTAYLHSRTQAECKEQCKPGTSSMTGLETCESCPLGQYQPEFGTRRCLKCPEDTSTVIRGAQDEHECGVPCSAGHFSRTGLVPCYPCPHDYYQPEEGRSYCLSCPFYGTTTVNGATAIQQCSTFGSSFLPKEESVTSAPEVDAKPHPQASSQVFHECFLNPCQNKGICEEVGVGYVCTCQPGFTGAKCESDIDECESDPCQNGGLCRDGTGDFHCECQPGFVGSLCEAEVNECSSSPCVNGGTCVDKVNYFACTCLDGYTGARCELEINECASSPCQNGGACEDLVGEYACACIRGFTGDNCEVNVNECDSAPCLNGGACVDGVNTYKCECAVGYSGQLCEVDEDECEPSPCQNGATCVDGPGAFTCRCPPGFNGTRCETEMSPSFNLDFEVSGIHGFVMIDGLMPSMRAITCTFWMRSSDTINYGTPVSYAVEGSDNAFLLIDYNGWVLYVNGKERITDCPAVNDGLWHHIGVSWRSDDGDWRVYIDGSPSDGGKGLSVGTFIPGGGVLVLGQDQDQRGEGFNPVESFVGSLSQLHIWNYVLSSQQIRALANGCPGDLRRGNVFAWPDFLQGVTGRVKVNPNCVFCSDCPLLDTAVPHLRVSSPAVSSGSQVQLSCDPGFYLVGEPLQQCLNKGEWSHALPKCEKVTCGVPPELEYGMYQGSDFHVGGLVTYQCRLGFYLLGEPKMQCASSGRWTGNPPACLDVDECALGSDCDEHASCQNTDGSHICTCVHPYSGDGHNCTAPVKCKDPGHPQHGHRDGTAFIEGSEVLFSCQEGFQLEGSGRVTCTQDGTWDSPFPYCRALSCSPPAVSENGDVSGTNYTFGSKVTFSCNKGYLPKEPSESQCLSTLNWSRDPPACSPVTCGEPPAVDQAEFTLTGRDYLSRVAYTCTEGYRLQGSAELQCEANGVWASPAPRCTQVDCGPPPPLPNAVTTGDDFTLGGQVHLECQEGYTLLGDKTRECLASGHWSQTSAQCAPRPCGPPPAIDHASSDEGHKLYGDTAIYSCNDGYIADNNTRMLCTAQGVWAPPTGLEVPRCIANFCQRPPELANAILDAINKPKYATNTEVSYKCDEGFVLNTTANLRCMLGGTWSPRPDEVSCVPIRCSRPQDIERGSFSGSDYSFGAMIAYTCETGYFIRGEKRRTCNANGEWGGSLPTCQPVTCSIPPPLINGLYRRRSQYVFNTKVTYICNAGYSMKGKGERMCQANRQWSNSDPPSCVLLTCDPPPDIKHGYYKGSAFYVGSKVTYTCHDGYELTTGEPVWTCTKYGKWDKARTPRCSPVQCPEPPLEENHLVLKNLDSETGTVELTCEEGYVLRGAHTLRCTQSQEWSEPFPACEQVFCGSPPDIPYGDRTLGPTHYGSTVTYSCMDGFVLRKGSEGATMTCQADGRWSAPTPECAPVECPQPEETANGIVDVHGLMYLSTAVYSCKAGYNLAGNATVICGQSGAWIGGVPACHPIECRAPVDIPNGKVSYGQLQFSRSVTYSCHQGYRLQGPETLTCLETGHWDQEAPTCEQVYCKQPEPISNGFVEGLDHKFGVTIFYSCVPGYQLVGQNHLTCEEHGWSSAVPVCVPTDCGLPPHIDFGDYSKLADPNSDLSGEDGDNNKLLGGKHDMSFLHGTAIIYRCHQGYEMSGGPAVVAALVCQEDGSWNGTAPSCVPVECIPPPSPEHGSVTVTDTALGSLVEYSCDEGYELEGQTVRQCSSSRQWSDDPPVCRLVSCGNPGDVSGGTVKGDSYSYLAVIHYECYSGYNLQGGDAARTCRADGKWDGGEPQCAPVSCGAPAVPSNILVKGKEYTFSKKLEFSCKTGFMLKGTPSATCQANGTWTQMSPSCYPADCGQPPALVNGRVTGSDYGYLSEVRYECNEGYALTGPTARVCRDDGMWDRSPPRCTMVTCDPPEDISHGYLNGSSFNFEDVVEYICFQGYQVVGNPFLRCGSDGFWVGSVPECRPCVCTPPVLKSGAVLGRDHNCGDRIRYHCDDGYRTLGPIEAMCDKGGVWTPGVPVCSRGRCPPTPPEVPNAILAGGSAVPPETLTYACKPGFQLQGYPHITCERNRWSEPDMSCEPVSCGAPPYIPNTRTEGDEFTFGSYVQYRCLDGYELATQFDTLSCQSDATWSKHSIRCKPMPCHLPTNLTHIVATGQHPTPLGGTVTLSCTTGFYLEGPRVVKCELGGLWSPGFTSSTCLPVTCEESPPILHGNAEGKGQDYGDMVIYSCLPGFVIKGDPVLTCQRDGRWSGNPPKCVAISCGKPPEVEDADVLVNSDTFESTVSYECHQGFRLVGPGNLTCLSDGKWSSPVPKCEASVGSCLAPGELPKGRVLEHNLASGQALGFRCDKGYVLQGEPLLVCMANGSWSAPLPVCTPKTCPPPPSWTNNSSSSSSSLQAPGSGPGPVFLVGQSVPVACPRGQQPKASSGSSAELTCRPDQTWSPISTACETVCWLQCQNGGSCQRPNICACQEGWMGRLCEEPICILPCLNGGRCVAPYQCECPTGWTGTRCHTAVCSSPCLNGGRCIRPNRCHCSAGWGGHDCSRKRKTGYFHF
ncbi:sushi, von Willebrand factor type A, EGF and pentraxin domain-containing protein 1 isoform X3 [Engraulis encrasicolus]|uniref:sushi, von Willebrand factor type A, EGF and pentraxin domain-containing protein 1 isoform X3 n=1 Tax=Engraulis encrasicolus TaxID=184585 RepID=UPI002FD6F396